MTTLITGATGSIGRLLVDDLLARGVAVRALSRDPAGAALPGGVTVFAGGLANAPADVFDGVEAVFVFPADDGADAFVERALSAGVQRFVVLSSLAVSGRNARDADSASGRHHRAIEEAVTSRTDRHTILRPGNLATNLLFWSFAIRSGQPVRIPYPESSQVLLHEADVAAAAAVALTASDPTERILELTGPTSLTKLEQLAAISSAIDREAPYVEISAEEFRGDMAPYLSGDLIEMLLRYWSETIEEPETPLPSPLGAPGRSLTQWAIDHRAAFSS